MCRLTECDIYTHDVSVGSSYFCSLINLWMHLQGYIWFLAVANIYFQRWAQTFVHVSLRRPSYVQSPRFSLCRFWPLVLSSNTGESNATKSWGIWTNVHPIVVMVSGWSKHTCLTPLVDVWLQDEDFLNKQADMHTLSLLLLPTPVWRVADTNSIFNVTLPFSHRAQPEVWRMLADSWTVFLWALAKCL